MSLKAKYNAKSKTHVQLLLENFNGVYVEEGNDVVNHVNIMAVLAKELSFLGNTLKKC